MRSALSSLALLALAHGLTAQVSYIVDSNSDQLFSVDLTTGAATLIASTANNGLSTPADLVWDGATSTLWTIDLDGGEVGTIDVLSGTFTPVYQTGLSGWQAMAWDPLEEKFYLGNQSATNLYVLDAATGVTTPIGASGQGLITAMTIAPDGVLWALGFSSGALMTLDKSTAAATVVGTAIAGIQGMAFAPNGRLFATNTNDDSLYAIDPVSATAILVGAHGAGVTFAKGLSVVRGAPNTSYIVDSTLDVLFAVDLGTGAARRIAPTNNNGLGTPADLIADSATSSLWTIDLEGGEVGTIDPASGTFNPIYQTNQSGWQAMAWDPFGQAFYLCNQASPDLYVLDPTTGTTTMVGAMGQGLVTAMALDARGELWGIGFSSGTLFRVNKSTAGTTVVGSSIAGFQGMAFSTEGRLYATNTNDDSLYEISTRTGAARLIGPHGSSVTFAKGLGIRRGSPVPVSSYLVDSNLDQLFAVDVASGTASLVASTANNGLTTPADLIWDPATSSMWTVDLSGGEVGTIDPNTGTFTPVFQTGQTGWQAMALDSFGRKLYLNNQTNPDLYVLDLVTGVTTQIGDTGQGLITAMAVDTAGRLWGIEFSGALVTLDTSTAAATVVAATTAGFQGMGFGPDGTLYAANTNDDSLYTVDTRTGVATLVGAHGAGVQFAKGLTVFAGGIEASGVGCTDSGGVQLTMVGRGVPALGSEVTFTCITQPASAYVLLVGLSDTFGPLGPLPTPFGPLAPGCSLYTSSNLAVGPLPWRTEYPLTIPYDPGLIGASLYFQGAELDPGLNAIGFAFSNYLTVTIH